MNRKVATNKVQGMFRSLVSRVSETQGARHRPAAVVVASFSSCPISLFPRYHIIYTGILTFSHPLSLAAGIPTAWLHSSKQSQAECTSRELANKLVPDRGYVHVSTILIAVVAARKLTPASQLGQTRTNRANTTSTKAGKSNITWQQPVNPAGLSSLEENWSLSISLIMPS